jgi:hypothetical protein
VIARGGRPEGFRRFDRSLAVDSDIAYFVTYPCPQCRLELETQHGGWQGWLRCPGCGAPSLPPEILLGHPATMRRVRELAGDDDSILVIGADAPDGPNTPDTSALIGEPPSALVSSLRLLFLTGMVISLFILLISFLDDNQIVTGFSSVLALTFFLLLLRLPDRRRRRR